MPSLRFITATVVSPFFLLLTTAAFAEMGSPAQKPSLQKTGWHTRFARAQAQAKALGKPLVLHFYADWCSPCRKMERTVLNQPAVLRCLGQDVVGVKINADDHPDLTSRFGVSGFPSDVLLSPAGEVSQRFVGIASESQYIARLKREGAKYPAKPPGRLAKKRQKSSATKTQENRGRQILGLEGYSPVALTRGQLWKKGQPEFAARYRGIVYRFANDEELELFLEDPAAYAPQLLGCDPVILAKSGRAVRGDIAHGVFFRNRAFFMTTEANREAFLKKPAFYANKKLAVEAEQIEQLVRR